jgi:hypothetical protein
MIQDNANTREVGWRIRKGREEDISKSKTGRTMYHIYRRDRCFV